VAQLTPQEQQEVLRFIEAGKPLPDKYRFLLFDEKREVELLWNGKNNEVSNVVLPFQTIELVDEPRSEKPQKLQESLFDLDDRGRQLKGWTNKLIWGDNKLILSSLKNGSLRELIETQGGIKLIYIDPPFDVGADFSMNIEIGEETLTKKPNILEEIAYRDTWGKGADSFVSMIYERLILMKDLLANDGSILVHCDWRVSAYMRLVLDEIFGKEKFKNEIIWKYSGGRLGKTYFGRKHDTIFWYSKSEDWIFNPDEVRDEYAEATKERFSNKVKNIRDGKDFGEQSLNPDGKHPEDVFLISIEAPSSNNRTGYPTQKPEPLLEKLIKATTNSGDLVADFFAGSGTTMAVAEKLGRKWIGSDLGKFSIHTIKKRMISIQRDLKQNGNDFRAFEILNLGKYERQHYMAVNENLRDIDKQKQREERESEFISLILGAYKAEVAQGFKIFQGKRNGRLIAIGPINVPVSRLFVEEVILEAREKRITRVDVLGFEFEMGLFPNVLDEAKAKGIDIVPRHIPAEVFDKRAIEKNQVVFHDVAAIEIKPIINKNRISIQLTDFSVFYSQDAMTSVEENLKDKASKVIVDKGQIVKISKDKDGIITREIVTRDWTDWIDYWSVDYNFESKREIVRIQNEQTKEFEEIWTGDFIFENEWQSFRTKKDRTLELRSTEHEVGVGRRKVAVKVVDIFGNDTMTIVSINIEGKK